MIDRRQGLKGFAATALGMTFGIGLRSEAEAQTRAETLRHVLGGALNTLDPTTPGSTRETYGVAMGVYDRLATFGRRVVDGNTLYDINNIRGELAEHIERIDEGKRYVFQIRKDATWHDGTPVTAQDVKWSLDRAVSAKSLAASQLATGSLEKPEQFRIVGDHAVEVVIDRGDRLALGNLCVPYAIMINSTLAKQHASSDDPWAMNWLKDNAAGGGAYTVEAYRSSQQTTLRRNESWKGGPLPFFRRVIVQTVPEAATRASLLERGDADICTDLQASDVPGIASQGHLKVVSVPLTNAFHAIVFNTQMPPFNDVKIRQAIAAALPYKDMFQASLFGRGRPLFGADWSTPPDTSFPQPFPIKTDLDRAKRLMAESSQPNGFSTTFSFGLNLAVIIEPAAALMKESLAKIGIDVTIQKTPDAQFSTYEVERRLPMFIDVGTAWLPSTDYFFRIFFTNNQRWNFANWNNQEVADLAQAARFETDEVRYKAACERMIEIAARELPMLQIWQPNLDAVMAPDISGFTYWSHRQVDYRDLKRG